MRPRVLRAKYHGILLKFNIMKPMPCPASPRIGSRVMFSASLGTARVSGGMALFGVVSFSPWNEAAFVELEHFDRFGCRVAA
jgi:hypothetical protein